MASLLRSSKRQVSLEAVWAARVADEATRASDPLDAPPPPRTPVSARGFRVPVGAAPQATGGAGRPATGVGQLEGRRDSLPTGFDPFDAKVHANMAAEIGARRIVMREHLTSSLAGGAKSARAATGNMTFRTQHDGTTQMLRIGTAR